MSELTNIHARAVKDLTTPTELPVDPDALDQVKLVAGNFPAEYAGNEAMTVGMIKDLVAQGREEELEVVNLKIANEESRAKEVEAALTKDKANKATTLSGYGISDAYPQAQIDSKVNNLESKKANKVDVDTALSNLSTTANKYYSTLAAANADIANIALNQSVTIGEEANSGLWEKKTVGATTLTRSPYDPINQAKLYSDVSIWSSMGKKSQSFTLKDYVATTVQANGTGDLFAIKLRQKSVNINTVMIRATSLGGLTSFTVALYRVDSGMKVHQVLSTHTLQSHPSNMYYISGLNIDIPDGQFLAVGVQSGVKVAHNYSQPTVTIDTDGFYYDTGLGASVLSLPTGWVPPHYQNISNSAGIGVRGTATDVPISYPSLFDTLTEETTQTHSYSGNITGTNANGEVYVSTVNYPDAYILTDLTVYVKSVIDESKTSFKVVPYFVDRYTREVKYVGAAIDFPIVSGTTKYSTSLNIPFMKDCYFALGVETGVDLGYYGQAGGTFGYSATMPNSLTLTTGYRLMDKQTINGKPTFIYSVKNRKVMSPADYVKKSELIDGHMVNYLHGKKVVALGDSMVQGHSLSDAANKTWLAKLANRNGMTRVNYGINGTYLSNRLYGTSEGAVVRYTAMDNDADYVLVFAGTNDARNSAVPMGTDDSTDTTTFKGALNVLCDGLITKYPNKKIGFITPYLRDSNYPPYVEAIETICAKYGIPVFNNIKNGGVCWINTAQLNAITLNDTYHLNEAGMDYASYKYEAFIRSL